MGGGSPPIYGGGSAGGRPPWEGEHESAFGSRPKAIRIAKYLGFSYVVGTARAKTLCRHTVLRRRHRMLVDGPFSLRPVKGRSIPFWVAVLRSVLQDTFCCAACSAHRLLVIKTGDLRTYSLVGNRVTDPSVLSSLGGCPPDPPFILGGPQLFVQKGSVSEILPPWEVAAPWAPPLFLGLRPPDLSFPWGCQ